MYANIKTTNNCIYKSREKERGEREIERERERESIYSVET